MDELSPSHSHDAIAEPCEVGVAQAIPLERGTGGVIGETIHLDDQSSAPPQEIHFVVTNPYVDLGGWQLRGANESQEPALGLRSRECGWLVAFEEPTQERRPGGPR
jgi:hypothetical protein